VADDRPPLERLLDLAVYAPIGLYTAFKDELPAYSRQGRQVVENRLMLAKFVGQMAVQQARREVDKRLAARQPAASTVVVDTVAHEVVDHGATSTASGDEVPSADSLAIPGYESVPAVNVVQRLATLLPDEIEQIRRFEVANRGRRTILAKIASLQGA
jgi:hypothetical protein